MVALSLKNPCCQKIDLVGTKAHGWPPALRVRWVLRRPGQPRHDKACHDKSEETQQQPLPLTAGDKVKARQGDAHPQQQAAERTKAPAVGTKRPCEPSTTGRRRKSHRARRPPATPAPASECHSSFSSCSSRMALSSLATQCHAFKQPIVEPGHQQRQRPGMPARMALVQPEPSAAPSSVGTTTDQPISPIMPRPNQTPGVELRRALSLRAAFAPTSPAKVGAFFDVCRRVVTHGESSRSDAEIRFPISP